jgi:nicotinamidase-related amidase
MALDLDGRAALLIHECQRGVIDPDLTSFPGLANQARERGIVPRIAQLARRFRGAGFPVLHTPIAHQPDFAEVQGNTLIGALARKHRGMMVGTDAIEIVEELAPEPGDIVVWRSSGIFAMHGTAVDSILRRRRISTLVLAGVSTNLGIAGCAMIAADSGYRVVIPEDCIAGSDRATHDIIVSEQLRMIARIVKSDEIEAVLGSQLIGTSGNSA